MSIPLEVFEVMLAALAAAGAVVSHLRRQKELGALREENAKLFALYTDLQERFENPPAKPPEFDEKGNALPPVLSIKELPHLDDRHCPFCGQWHRITYTFCGGCTSKARGILHRIMVGHFHVHCGECGAAYFQREKRT